MKFLPQAWFGNSLVAIAFINNEQVESAAFHLFLTFSRSKNMRLYFRLEVYICWDWEN